MPGTQQPLIELSDSVLLLIDVQDAFLEKLKAAQREPLVERIAWLVDVALHLNVPIIATAEDIQNMDGMCAELEAHLPDDLWVHDKMNFSLASDLAIMKAVNDTRRKTAILVGLETDVCVAQSAIGLLDHHFQVVVVQDACASPGESHQVGLQRMSQAGIIQVSTKSLYYEWIRTVRHALEVEESLLSRITLPESITL